MSNNSNNSTHECFFCYKLMCLCEREYVISEYLFFFTYISTYMSQITILLQEPLIPNYTVHSSPSNTQNRIQTKFVSKNETRNLWFRIYFVLLKIYRISVQLRLIRQRNVAFTMINMKPCYPMKPKSNQREEIKIPKQLEIS